MSTVIGLCPCDGDIDLVIQGLEKAGFPRKRMRILTSENRILKLFSCKPNCVVAKYAGMGALVYAGASHLPTALERESKKYTLFSLSIGVLVAFVIVCSKG